MLNRPLPAPARDIALLIGRILLGVVLFAHGWQKLVIHGIAGTYGQFEKLGIPLAIVSASFTSFVEFVGGALLIVGALTTTVIALDLVVMVGAAGFVHVTHGIFAQDGGWELVGVIVAAELALAATGPGRFSVDHLISSRRLRDHGVPAPPLHAPVLSDDAFTPAVRPTPQETSPTEVRQVVGFTPRTAPQPTVAQQTAIVKATTHPESAAHTERLLQVPPVARPVTVADLVSASGPRPGDAARRVGETPAGDGAAATGTLPAQAPVPDGARASAEPPAPVELAGAQSAADTRQAVAAAPLFEPYRPLIDAQPAFGPRRPFDAAQSIAMQMPFVAQAPNAVQQPGELPQRVRRTDRVGHAVTPQK